jgi:hypothetical protein
MKSIRVHFAIAIFMCSFASNPAMSLSGLEQEQENFLNPPSALEEEQAEFLAPSALEEEQAEFLEPVPASEVVSYEESQAEEPQVAEDQIPPSYEVSEPAPVDPIVEPTYVAEQWTAESPPAEPEIPPARQVVVEAPPELAPAIADELEEPPFPRVEVPFSPPTPPQTLQSLSA